LVEYQYKIGVIRSDMGGCFQLRILQPFAELRRHGVDYYSTCFLPVNIGEPRMETLVRWIEQFDLIIVQRCFKYNIFKLIRDACHIASRKLVFETDDDYINLPKYNPCSKEMEAPGALEGFLRILSEADYITVTTQELKDIYYPFNPNIYVVPNNVENVSLFKDNWVHPLGEDGRVPLVQTFGFTTYPTYVQITKEVNKVPQPHLEKIIRIGYSATPTHMEDYKTILEPLGKVLKKHPNIAFFLIGGAGWIRHDRKVNCKHCDKLDLVALGRDCIGDWFVDQHPPEHKNIIHLPTGPYELYHSHLRNLDIGLAPLVPDIFNMSKSPLKLLELASWGVPAVAPNFITYNRCFEHGKTAMLYYNEKEFAEYLEELITNHDLRIKMGLAAARMVNDTRTERVNSAYRFHLYEDMIKNSPKHLRFTPNKEKVSA
jgi:glycosyltransferase involved in cell wall biosynthesis